MSMIICLQCSSSFIGTIERKFCSKSCSTSYRNKGKSRTEAEKNKVRLTIRKKLEQKEIFSKTNVESKFCIECQRLFWTKRNGRKYCDKKCQNIALSKTCTGKKRESKIYGGKPTKTFLAAQYGYIKPESKKKRRIKIEKSCLICESIFTTKTGKGERKTCSNDCHYHLLSGKTGHTTHPEHNCMDGKTIILGSSWEKTIAIFLDEKNIIWTRPKSLDYIDISGKQRKYFPDFYLPEYNIYLDPKNPMKIKKDQYKLDYFKDKICLYYGSVKNIKKKVVEVLGLEPRPPGNLPAPLRSAL